MKKEYIIPIFVPNYGCENDCIFCNQEKISGKKAGVTPKEVKETIQYYLKNFKDDNKYVEVAFFGGSFTGIDEKTQNELLEAANEFIKSKQVNSIRISTRPDYIDKKTLKRLKKYNVKTIELGVQSSNDYILEKSKRGHNFEDVKKASKMIRWHRFNLGHQMMVGLPESTRLDELNTARDLIKLKPKMVRIYPVLVIKGTQLAKEYASGEYEPLTVDRAVDRCKEITYLFRKKKIDVIRIGLQTTDEITYKEKDGSQVLAGPFHPAFRQLVEGAMWYDSLQEKIKEINTKAKKVEIIVNPEDSNNVIGHRKTNVKRLQDLYEIEIVVTPKEDLAQGKFEINVLETY